MPLALLHDRSAWLRWAVGLWTVAVLVVCSRAALAPARNSVYPIFTGAAANWMAGAGLYGATYPDRDVYRYSPLVAGLYVPFALLPDGLGAVLWRLLNAGFFL